MQEPLVGIAIVILPPCLQIDDTEPPPPTGGLLRASAQAQFPTLNTAFTKSCL